MMVRGTLKDANGNVLYEGDLTEVAHGESDVDSQWGIVGDHPNSQQMKLRDLGDWFTLELEDGRSYRVWTGDGRSFHLRTA